MRKMVRNILWLLLSGLISVGSVSGQSFLDQQMEYPVFKKAFQQKDQILRKEFEKKGLKYPANYIFIRSFKYDSKLEVWVKNKPADTFALFKTYHICALSGYMGPKRFQGDRQVPEGFYYISRFNPRSEYHLALKVNYPNFSDRLKSTHKDPGGGIYIHGSCVTVGCIPITNPLIDELYILAAYAKDAGQDYIPVHILPINFNNKKSVEYLSKASETDNPEQKFWLQLKKAFDYFNETHRLPVVLYDGEGNYVVEGGRKLTPLKRNYSTTRVNDLKLEPGAVMN